MLISLTMLKGKLGNVTSYIGIFTGIFGIVATVGPFFMESLGMMAIATSVLTIIWVFMVGYKLLKFE